ncbi:MAG: hypothetical protein HOF69_02275 [Campylobacteraceae bacterium]|nr:hypothetical protein [Campylobacteraceae bacterium]
MKNNLGKIFLLIILLVISSKASNDFSYKFNISKGTNVNLKEAVYLELEIKQLKYKNNIMFFKFNPIENDNFDIYFLKLDEVSKPNNKKLVYSYLIYPKVIGKKKIDFSLFVQRTNEDGLKPGYEGDRDNVLGMVSKDSYETIKPIVFDIKKPKSNNKVFDNFVLSYDIKKTTFNPYEPIYITYTLKGDGYPPLINDLFQKSDKYEYFLDKPIKKIIHKKNGSSIEYIFKYAFISKDSFAIPEVKMGNLETPSIDIIIKKSTQKILLDKKTIPTKSIDKNKIYFEYLVYILIFVSGFISAKLVSNNVFNRNKLNIKKEISPENIKDKKERLIWMINTNKQLYKDDIKKLEDEMFCE